MAVLSEAHEKSLDTGDGSLTKLVAPVLGLSRCVIQLLEWMYITMFQLMVGLTGPQLLSRAYFLPGILVNTLKLRISGRFKWYNRIDDTVILGALPFRSQAEELVKDENIRAVISINEDFELQWFTPSTVEWQQLRVHQYQFPVVDRAAPSLDMIDEALQVIQRHAQRKETVYIHCKSGQGRSATIVASYLIKKYKWSPEVAINLLQRKRPQVGPTRPQRRTLQYFYNHINRDK